MTLKQVQVKFDPQLPNRDCHNNSILVWETVQEQMVSGWVQSGNLLFRHSWNYDGEQYIDYTENPMHNHDDIYWLEPGATPYDFSDPDTYVGIKKVDL